jgi:hypothetical protein
MNGKRISTAKTMALLLRMKQTYRDKDVIDRRFLEDKLEREST